MSWKGVYQSPCDLVPYWPPWRSNSSSCGASMGMPYNKKQQWKFWEWCPYCTLPPRGHIVIVLGTIWASIDKYQTVSEPQTPWILLVTEEKKEIIPFVHFEFLMDAFSSPKIGSREYGCNFLHHCYIWFCFCHFGGEVGRRGDPICWFHIPFNNSPACTSLSNSETRELRWFTKSRKVNCMTIFCMLRLFTL